MIGSERIVTSTKWSGVSSALTSALASSSITTRDDILVQIVDEDTPNVDKMPIAWYVPATSDIVLNATKISGMNDFSFAAMTPAALYDKAREFIGGTGYFVRSYEDGELLDERFYDEIDRTFARIRGVLVHECGHTMWSHYLLDGWWREPRDPRINQIITMLDEVRIEGLQADREDQYRMALRLSARMLLPGHEDVEEMRTAAGSGMLDMFSVSLNMMLLLGRRDQGVLLDYEVRELRHLAEDLFGLDKVEHMRDIWNEFAEIDDLTREKEHAIALAQEWLDLVTDKDGENEQLTLAGLFDLLAEIFGSTAEAAERWAANDKQWGTVEDMLPSKEAAEKVFKTKKCKRKDCPICRGEDHESSHGYTRTDTGSFGSRLSRPAERQTASMLAKRLEKLSTPARTETKVRSKVPPGRLKSRAALQISAARSRGLMSSAEPWEHKRRKHHDSSKLTVGVMTDVSGSMRWAEDMVASFSWIVNKAVRHVNGTSAAVVFGSRAQPVLGPGDRLTDKVITRKADDGSEAANEAFAALDGLLNLTEPENGVRVLFVVSDGMLVDNGEMAAADKWVKKLTRSGCVVVWISNEPQADMKTRTYRGYNCAPRGARYVQASSAGPSDVNRMIDEVVKALESKRS